MSKAKEVVLAVVQNKAVRTAAKGLVIAVAAALAAQFGFNIDLTNFL